MASQPINDPIDAETLTVRTRHCTAFQPPCKRGKPGRRTRTACENFLYDFKAARHGPLAPPIGRHDRPARGGRAIMPRPIGWRRKRKAPRPPQWTVRDGGKDDLGRPAGRAHWLGAGWCGRRAARAAQVARPTTAQSTRLASGGSALAPGGPRFASAGPRPADRSPS
jgi:hypothetical protein